MRCLAISISILLLAAACSSSNDAGPSGPNPPPDDSSATSVVVGAAGNVVSCALQNDEATASLLDSVTTVFALGDMVVGGDLDSFNNCYEPSWGRHKAKTYAVMGNHEYVPGNADGAFTYFGDRAGPANLGYYSFDLGDWHIIVLNDNDDFVPYAPGSAQAQWLTSDLAANTKACTLAMWHQPLFLSSNTSGFTVRPTRRVLWNLLYDAGVDVVLNGGQHHYERMKPMNPAGDVDDATGIRQFNVGTGGESVLMPTVALHPNSEVRGDAFGVLRLTLRSNGYDWSFVPITGQSFTDSGSGTCH